MPRKKAEAPAPTPTGYRPRLRSRWVEIPADLIDVDEGGEPFKAKIRSHLTFGEIDDIPYGQGVKYVEIEEAIAPYVLEWNVLAVNDETGELEPVPPPAEAGPVAFKCLGGFEIEWLAMELKKTSLGTVDQLKAAEKAGTLTSEQADLKKG